MEFSKKYLIENKPDYIQNDDLWNKAINISTDNGQIKAKYSATVAIYNSLEKLDDDTKKDWITTNYNYWKRLVDQSNMSSSKRKYLNEILITLKKYGKVSPKQFKELQNFKNGNNTNRYIKENNENDIYNGYGYKIIYDTTYIKSAKNNEICILPLDNSARKYILNVFRKNNLKYRTEDYHGGYLTDKLNDVYFKEKKERVFNFDSFDKIKKSDLEEILENIQTVNPMYEYDECINIVYEKLNSDYPNGYKNIPSTITLYRYIGLENINDLNKNEVGVHFTNNIKYIDDDFIESIRASRNNGYILEITTSSENINIYETIMHNLEYPNENEITLNKNSKLEIVNIQKY